MSKIFVSALDGATWTLLQPWINQGALPNLAALQREGASGILRSTLPVITSAAWSAFSTGKNPSNTGIYDFFSCQKNSYLVRTVTRLQVKGVSLWKQLSRHGKKSIIINVPMTYPAEEDPNILTIAGIPAPHVDSPGFTHPPDLFERFRLNRHQYRISVRLPKYEGRYGDLIADLREMVREHLRAAEVLIKERWDLFMIHFYATDVIQHALWKFVDPGHPQYDPDNAAKYGDGLLEVFSEVDQAIGRLLSLVDLDHTTILVMSDHGFGPNRCTFHINRWLQNIGMLKLHPPFTRFGSDISRILLSKSGLPSDGMTGQIMRRMGFILGCILPLTLQNGMLQALRHLLSRSPVGSNLLNPRGYRHMLGGMDWGRTRAYSVGTTGLIRINLRGREPQGAVSPGQEYEEVREVIAKGLLALTDADGQKLLDRVFRKEEVYRGSSLDEAPDLIPLSETVGCYFYPFLDREGIVTEAECFRSGNHRRDGILIAKGPFIKQEGNLGTIDITDLAPTILYALGVPVPRDMDGSVTREMFQPQFLAEHPLQQSEASEFAALGQTVLPDDEIQMAKKLEDLGYL
jgi:predicted AlkP superfamily phosphohydrolase/phosphomutase